MSVASQRGKDFEKRLAKMIRTKLHASHGIKAMRDPRSGAGEVYKADIAIPGFPWSIEAKSQSTIKLREWWLQSESACPIYKQPLLVIDDSGYNEWAVMRFSTFLDLVATILDDTETIKVLRSRNDNNQLQKGSK